MEEETRKQEAEGEGPKLDLKLEKPADKMTATELREVAKNIPGVEGAHAMKKEELVALVKGAMGIKDEGPPPTKGRKKAAKGIVELKGKIRELRAEKTRALEGKDKKKVKVLRRRINRMKKLTRKVEKG
jgi:cell division protein FtsX